MATVPAPSAAIGPVGLRGLARAVRANERLLYGILGFVVFIIVWEAAADLGLYRRSLLSSPSLVWAAAVEDFGSGVIWPDLLASGLEFSRASCCSGSTRRRKPRSRPSSSSRPASASSPR